MGRRGERTIGYRTYAKEMRGGDWGKEGMNRRVL